MRNKLENIRFFISRNVIIFKYIHTLSFYGLIFLTCEYLEMFSKFNEFWWIHCWTATSKAQNELYVLVVFFRIIYLCLSFLFNKQNSFKQKKKTDIHDIQKKLNVDVWEFFTHRTRRNKMVCRSWVSKTTLKMWTQTGSRGRGGKAGASGRGAASGSTLSPHSVLQGGGTTGGSGPSNRHYSVVALKLLLQTETEVENQTCGYFERTHCKGLQYALGIWLQVTHTTSVNKSDESYIWM